MLSSRRPVLQEEVTPVMALLLIDAVFCLLPWLRLPRQLTKAKALPEWPALPADKKRLPLPNEARFQERRAALYRKLEAQASSTALGQSVSGFMLGVLATPLLLRATDAAPQSWWPYFALSIVVAISWHQAGRRIDDARRQTIRGVPIPYDADGYRLLRHMRSRLRIAP